MLANGFFGYGGLYVGREKEITPGFPQMGHHLYGGRAGMQYPLGPTTAIFATVAFEDRRFGGQDALFLVQRHDKQTNASIGISWVPVPEWRITPQFAWTSTDSTVPLAEYNRRTVSVALRREF
jgi:hypothetical protein